MINSGDATNWQEEANKSYCLAKKKTHGEFKNKNVISLLESEGPMEP